MQPFLAIATLVAALSVVAVNSETAYVLAPVQPRVLSTGWGWRPVKTVSLALPSIQRGWGWGKRPSGISLGIYGGIRVGGWGQQQQHGWGHQQHGWGWKPQRHHGWGHQQHGWGWKQQNHGWGWGDDDDDDDDYRMADTSVALNDDEQGSEGDGSSEEDDLPEDDVSDEDGAESDEQDDLSDESPEDDAIDFSQTANFEPLDFA